MRFLEKVLRVGCSSHAGLGGSSDDAFEVLVDFEW